MKLPVPSLLSMCVYVSLVYSALSRHQRHHRYRSLEGGGRDYRSYFRDPLKNIRSTPLEENCPVRNEFQVRAKGMNCVRRCLVDADCQNDRKLCLCDGLCGKSCIRPEKECPELADPANGRVDLNGRHFQDTAEYSCNDGYLLVGVEISSCQASGRWSGIAPSCREASNNAPSPYYCGQPPRIENANHNGSEDQTYWDLDTELTYQCFAGFKRDGFDHAKCFYMNGTATWYGPDLHCKPIQCGPPEDILNGIRTGLCTSYRCQMKYDCLPGFILRGKDTRICERDGLWSQNELPTCEAVQCPLPLNPGNGKALFTAVSYKSVVSYECNYGYMIVGNATRMCESDRTWSGSEPECKEINCGPPGGGLIPNGWLEGSRTSMHSVVAFKCLEGMTLEGEDSTVCGTGGRWSNPVPKCLAPCIIPEIQHGKSSDRIGDKIPHGNITKLECESRYETFSNSTPIQCNNGTWTQIPKCFPARCKTMPSPPKNGMIVVPKVSHGSVGLYQCKDGYRLIGKNTTFCDFGNWTEKTPVCQEIYCPFPGTLPNGKVLLVGNMGLYDYRPYVKRISNDRQIMFDCNKEYRLDSEGPRGATCVDGKWSPNLLPTCLPDNHPNIRWLDKRSVKSEEVEEVLKELKAAAGLRLIPTKETIVGSIPTLAPGPGSTSTKSPGLGSIPTMEKELKKSPRRRKREAIEVGRGGGEVGRGDCDVLDTKLMDLELLKGGRQGPDHNRNGATVKVICKQGYHLANSKSKYRCRKGEWKPEMPACQQNICLIPEIEHGKVNEYEEGGQEFGEGDQELDGLEAGFKVFEGGRLEVSCDTGFRLSGQSSIVCINGQWSRVVSCLPEPCLLPIIEHGYYTQSNLSVGLEVLNGQQVAYDCFSGYGQVDRSAISCQAGQLLPSPPQCSRLGTTPHPDLSTQTYHEDPVLSTYCGRPGQGPGGVNQAQLSFLSAHSSSSNETYPDGSVLSFGCINADKQIQWKIRCVSGSWVGSFSPCNQQTKKLHDPCLYELRTPNLVAFFKGQQVRKRLYIETGAILEFRCSDIGKYKLFGDRRMICGGGELQGQSPICTPLSQHYEYALDKPPTILFRHQQGPIAQTISGDLMVNTGTVLHMECLFLKKFGTPKWTTRRVRRKVYPQGWAMGRMRDSTLEYRISIYHANAGDTGAYTCTTPAGESTTVNIIVDNVTCPDIPLGRFLRKSSNDTKLSSEIKFSCSAGKKLFGPAKLLCLPTGSWSDIPPACEKITCPSVNSVVKDPHVNHQVLSYRSGGEVTFSCPLGYKLHGDRAAQCGHTATWSIKAEPRCEPVFCPMPLVPDHGALQTTGPFRVGDISRFVCNLGFMMVGESVSACIGKGTWSSPSPTCVTACTYPGTPPGGYLDNIQFYYPAGSKVQFFCDRGLHIQGARILQCTDSGHWTGPVPTCSSN